VFCFLFFVSFLLLLAKSQKRKSVKTPFGTMRVPGMILRAGLLLLTIGFDPVAGFTPYRGAQQYCSGATSPRTQTRRFQSSDSSAAPLPVRFLGKGERAIVRNGVVLIAPADEFHHFYRQAAIFIYSMGQLGDNDDDDYLIRGLIIDHPTPFTLNEMIDVNTSIVDADNPLGEALVWRGGDKGGEGVVLLHSRADLGQPQIGLSGLYQGGWDAALDACAEGKANADDDFKIFFNYCEFTEQELESMLELDEEGDSWISVEVDPSLILNADWNRGACWARLRNAVRQITIPE
jgi:hypothetical protein